MNPETFSEMNPTDDKAPPGTMWFIGLEFQKSENLNIDLTYDIQSFTTTGKYFLKTHQGLYLFFIV